MKCGKVTLWDSGPTEDPEDSYDGDLHVIPCFELDPMHLSHASCWCQPELIEKGEDRDVWSHRIMN